MRKAISLLALWALAVSCRGLVLEDRMECPAFLSLEMANASSFDIADHLYVAAFRYPDGTLLGKDTTTVHAVTDGTFFLKVKRSDTVVGYGVLGYGGALLRDGTDWVVPEGSDYVPLWRFGFRAGAPAETIRVPVEATKEHSRVKVFFKDYDLFPGTGGHFPFEVVVRSNTCGLNALTGEPVKGAYRFRPEERTGGTFRFTVPRQFDRSLTMEVWTREEYSGGEREKVAEIGIWSWAQATDQFSWEDRNLKDISITVELSRGGVHVDVVPWQGDGTGYEYEF